MTNRRTLRLSPSQDVRPVTEFRAHASAFLQQIRATKHPLILTQHGRCAAVLLDISLYEELLGELAMLRGRRSTDPREPLPPAAPLVRTLPS
ncbi:MAG TPA: type II toxin-antitoxin system Phd/YefM family antitoxin [Gemmatimonadales bacterium]|nr:type II toxin-antitoxin system Phd/YefM family antitoxin [Gemmatimonadales bacterium]HSC58710.1 type II toxin-antitoxin system Phd/YefM family antitoxin [Gemmatimonadales bacterium]